VRVIDMVCPGFAVDCLETLEENAVENAALFRRAGGTELRYIPALNASPGHVAALAALARRHAQGWPH
jgi:ferrochelatase